MGEWATVTRRGATPPRWAMEQELQDLREEMAWMRSRISAPPQGSKGKGKGKGLGKGQGASQGSAPPPQNSEEGPARRKPNLKPLDERATPTQVEVRCPKCQQCNWTTRSVCRSCETPLARPQGVSDAGTQSAPAPAKTSGTVPGKSYAQAAAGAGSQSVLLLDKEALSKRQAELETVIATLPEDSPLKEELGTQLDTVKEKLKDPRQPGARLDSATASLKKATARREKAEETLKQAQEALEKARLEETRAEKELEEAKKAAAPPPPLPEHPPEGVVSLSSADVEGVIGLLPRTCCRKGGARRRTPAEEEPMQPVRSDRCGASCQERCCQSQTRTRVGVLGPSLRGGSEIWGWVLPGRRPCEGAPARIPCPSPSQWRRPRDRSAASARAASRRPSSGPHAGRRGQPDAGCPEEVSVPRLRGSGTRSRPSLTGAGLLLLSSLCQTEQRSKPPPWEPPFKTCAFPCAFETRFFCPRKWGAIFGG